MKISYKLHRNSAILTSVVLAVTQLIAAGISLFSVIRSGQFSFAALGSIALGMVPTGLMIAVLLRGRKDFLAGILCFLAAAPCALAIFSNATAAMTYVVVKNPPSGAMVLCGISASMILIMASVTSAVFYVMLALECIKPGKVSDSRFKALLLILPAAFVVLSALAVPVRIIYTAADVGVGVYMGAALKSFGTGLVLKLGLILTGLTFLVPIKADILDENGNPAP